jgi:hypothetical protein
LVSLNESSPVVTGWVVGPMNPAVDVLALGIGTVLAACLWMLSEDFFDHFGVTPWGVPPVLWALLVASIALFAVIVPARVGLAAFFGFGALGLWILARVTTWYEVAPGRDDEHWLAAQRSKLAGWFADPVGRHERRYFDGRSWTDWVFDDGAQSSDRLPSAARLVASAAAPAPAPGWPPATAPLWASAAAWVPGVLPPPAWHADPTGRYRWRYWDGEHWTRWVSDGAEARLERPL